MNKQEVIKRKETLLLKARGDPQRLNETKNYDKPRQHTKKQRHHFADKGL